MISKKLKGAWYSQKFTAERRGIEFSLSFYEWLDIWKRSGKLAERGRKKGQYCMARFEDKGPYCKENVQIILHSENTTDGWKLHRDATSKKMSIVHKGKPKPWLVGRTKSPETIKKFVASRKKNGYIPMRGARSLTDDQVRKIRRLGYSYTATEIGKLYNANPGIIVQILQGRTYREVR